MRVVLSFILSAVALGLSAVSAHASPITINADVSASGFGAGAPVDPVTGSFSITLDTAIDVSTVVAGGGFGASEGKVIQPFSRQ